MKRIIACIMVLLLSTSVRAQNYEQPMASDYDHSIYTLERLNIIPSDYDTTGNATRIECLSMLVAISEGTGIDTYAKTKDYVSYADDVAKKYSDADMLSDSEKLIVWLADIKNFLQGIPVDNELYVHPDKELTWREAIRFTLRLTCPEYEYYNPKEESLISGALYRKYIYFDDIAGLDSVVTDYELCHLINKALHEPVITHTYSGEVTRYFIDYYTFNRQETF